MRSLVAAVALLLIAGSASAQSPSGADTFSRSALATPTGRAVTTAEMVARINAMAMRPIPSTPPQPVVRADTTWVPDRWIPVPGGSQTVFVPGHWERSLANGNVYVAPLATTTPSGDVGLVHAGERLSVDQRSAP